MWDAVVVFIRYIFDFGYRLSFYLGLLVILEFKIKCVMKLVFLVYDIEVD